MSLQEQWFYDALAPGEHYLETKKDLSDLLEKIEWARNNDVLAHKIMKNAEDFVENNLTPCHLDAYLAELLREYTALLSKE